MTDMTTTTAPRPPGRPRSARADEAIIDAVLDFLAEGTTVEARSMEAVAARAGVGKATIYRRWPHKEALVLDAVSTLKGPVPAPAGRSVRDDLVMIVRLIADARDSRAGKIMPCIMPELQRNTPLRERYLDLVEQRRDITREVLRRGVRTGELRPDTDVELVQSMLSGVMMSSLLGNAPHLDRTNLAERLVDTVLTGIAGQPRTARVDD